MARSFGCFSIYYVTHTLFFKPILGTGWPSFGHEDLDLDLTPTHGPEPVDSHFYSELLMTIPWDHRYQAEDTPWESNLSNLDHTDPQLATPLENPHCPRYNAIAAQAHVVATRPSQQSLSHSPNVVETAHAVQTAPHERLGRKNPNVLALAEMTMKPTSDYSGHQEANSVTKTRAMAKRPRTETGSEEFAEARITSEATGLRALSDELTSHSISSFVQRTSEESPGLNPIISTVTGTHTPCLAHPVLIKPQPLQTDLFDVSGLPMKVSGRRKFSSKKPQEVADLLMECSGRFREALDRTSLGKGDFLFEQLMDPPVKIFQIGDIFHIRAMGSDYECTQRKRLLKRSFDSLMGWICVLHKEMLRLQIALGNRPQNGNTSHELIKWLWEQGFTPKNGLPAIGASTAIKGINFGLVAKLLLKYFATSKTQGSKFLTAWRIIGIWFKNRRVDEWNEWFEGSDGTFWMFVEKLTEQESLEPARKRRLMDIREAFFESRKRMLQQHSGSHM